MTITYSEESLERCKADIEYLMPEHWAELGDAAMGLECKPEWRLYEAAERAGSLVLLMARVDGEAIGYLLGFLHPHIHSREHRAATLSTYFIRSRPSRALITRSLLSHAVNLALKRGACKVSVETEYDHSAGRILEAMGFRPKSIKYVMAQGIEEKVYA